MGRTGVSERPVCTLAHCRTTGNGQGVCLCRSNDITCPPTRLGAQTHRLSYRIANGGIPYYGTIIYAFANLPVASSVLKALVDAHCRDFNDACDTEENGELKLRAQLPNLFLVGVMVRYASIRSKKVKLRRCDYHEHAMEEEKKECQRTAQTCASDRRTAKKASRARHSVRMMPVSRALISPRATVPAAIAKVTASQTPTPQVVAAVTPSSPANSPQGSWFLICLDLKKASVKAEREVYQSHVQRRDTLFVAIQIRHNQCLLHHFRLCSTFT